MALDPKQLDILMKTVSDPRYNQETYTRALKPTAELKLAVAAGGLIPAMNRAYKWDLAESGDWEVERINDIIYEIVSKPGYTLEAFLAAIRAGRRL